MRHRITPYFGTAPAGDGEIDAPGASLSPSQGSHTSGNCVNLASHASDTQRCDSVVSGNPLPHLFFVQSKTQPTGREENCAHGETSPPQIWHTAGETAPAVAEAGTGSDRRRLRHERGGATPARPGAPLHSPRVDRPVPAPAVRIGSTLRQQALAELLNDLAEYRAASPAFRPFWRKLALHDVARFKRDWLRPERAAFEAAVARSQRRAA